MVNTVDNILSSIYEHLTLLLRQVPDSPLSEENVVLAEFMIEKDNSIREITLLSTQITQTLSQTPAVNLSELQDFIHGLEVAVDKLTHKCKCFPFEHGSNLHKFISDNIELLLNNLISWIRKLRDVKTNQDHFSAVGLVWSACEQLEKLPKDNKEATILLLKDEEVLLNDAVSELEVEMKTEMNLQRFNDVDNSETWTNQDKELLPPCLGLVKTARSCLKKLVMTVKSNAECKTEVQIKELDNVCDVAVELSPVVDDFILTIYPPLRRDVVKSSAIAVVNIIQNLLNQIIKCHFVKEEDKKWVNFLLKAVDHNNNKLYPLLCTE